MNYIKSQIDNRNGKKIANYLISSFKSKSLRAARITRFYSTLCMLYVEYPNTVKKIVDNIEKWGYYGDYFHILLAADNLCKKKIGYIYTRVNPKNIIRNRKADIYVSSINEFKKLIDNESLNDNKNDTVYTHKYISTKLRYKNNYSIRPVYIRNTNMDAKLQGFLEYIYKCVSLKLHHDEQLMIDGKFTEISTLAKWMPRKGHSVAKNVKSYMRNIIKYYYGNEYDSYEKKKSMYDKLIVKLSSYLCITEQHIQNKTLDNIDYNKIPFLSLIKNKKPLTITVNNENRYMEALYNKLNNKPLSYIINIILKYNMIPSEHTVFTKIFNDNIDIYSNEIHKKLGITHTYDVLVDLSKHMYDSKNIDIVIAILVVLHKTGSKIIVNGKNPKIIQLTDNLINNINKLFYSMTDVNNIMFEKGLELSDGRVIIITSQKLYTNSKLNLNNIGENIIYIPSKFTTFKQLNYNIFRGNMLFIKKCNKKKQQFINIINSCDELYIDHVPSLLLIGRLLLPILMYTIFCNCLVFMMSI